LKGSDSRTSAFGPDGVDLVARRPVGQLARIIPDDKLHDYLEILLSSTANSVSQVLIPDTFMFTHRKRIVESHLQTHLPAIYGYREFVDDGGLVSYGPSISIPIAVQPLTQTRF